MLPFLIQEFLKNVYLCPIVAFNKSYEILIPRSKDQNILTIQNILAFSKSLSCSCNRCILLLAFVSLGWETQLTPGTCRVFWRSTGVWERLWNQRWMSRAATCPVGHKEGISSVKIQTAWEVNMKQMFLFFSWQLPSVLDSQVQRFPALWNLLQPSYAELIVVFLPHCCLCAHLAQLTAFRCVQMFSPLFSVWAAPGSYLLYVLAA